MSMDIQHDLQRAIEAHKNGNLALAVELYQHILRQSPHHPDALRFMGLAAIDLGKPKSALQLLLASAELRNAPDDWRTLGRAAFRCSAHDIMSQAFSTAAALEPDHGHTYLEWGDLLLRTGAATSALEPLLSARLWLPDSPEPLVGLGQAFVALNRLDDALSIAEQGLAEHAGDVRFYQLTGSIHRQKASLERAAQSYSAALAFMPHDPVSLGNLGFIRQMQGEIEEALTLLDRALQAAPRLPSLLSNRLMAEQYRPSVTAASLLPLHQRIAATLQPSPPLASEPVSALLTRCPPHPNRPLRIGYLSPDLGKHPVGNFMAAFFPFLSDDSQVFCYSDRAYRDDLTAFLQSCPVTWRSVYGASDAALAQQIRTDAIDILVDLAGHTANNRMSLFSQRIAPLQVSWAGYVGTTGVPTMDVLLADRFHVPIGEDDLYSETVVRMPEGYVPYAPPSYAPPVAPLPAANNGYITFGSMNNLAKLHHGVISLWTQILAAVPNSRLLLKTDVLSDRGTVEKLRNRFASGFQAAGIDPDRLICQGRTPHAEHLAAYHQIDIALDSFPYCGGVTTLEALWMGVPVITLTGQTFAGRHSTSHMSVAGLTDWITQTPEDYCRKAVALAHDLPALSDWRKSLRGRLQSSPTLDGQRFARQLEAVYRKLWQDWCQQHKASAPHEAIPS